MARKVSLHLSLVLAILATCGIAAGDVSIPVPNGSFENPPVGVGGFQFWGNASPSPGAWATTGEGGVVNNTNGRFGPNPTGVDGTQVGFLDGPPCGFWQDSITTFQVGQSYTLTMAFCERGDYAGDEGDLVRVALFGREAGGGAAVAASVTLNHTQLANGVVLTDYTVTVPEVQSTDAWAGLPLGIWVNADPFTASSGIFFDNARLTTTGSVTGSSTWTGNVDHDFGLDGNWTEALVSASKLYVDVDSTGNYPIIDTSNTPYPNSFTSFYVGAADGTNPAAAGYVVQNSGDGLGSRRRPDWQQQRNHHRHQ